MTPTQTPNEALYVKHTVFEMTMLSNALERVHFSDEVRNAILTSVKTFHEKVDRSIQQTTGKRKYGKPLTHELVKSYVR